jgi:uncharacterized 2Fe-2S/4Fe-4S cluster protein (DUF4445 family)/ferredoxin
VTAYPHLKVLHGAGEQETTLQALPRQSDPTLADVLLANDLPINTRCHQRGWCRGCLVHLDQGRLTMTDGATVVAPASVHACLVRADARTEAVIRVPDRSLVSARPQVGMAFSIDTPYSLNPLFPWADHRGIACAVDLGTTTVVVLLVDSSTGEILSRAGGFNAQVRYGDNVLTRIMHASSPSGLDDLRKIVIRQTIAPLLREACRKAGCDESQVSGMTVAGNTTMLHLLAGESPESIGIAPFTPVFLDTCRLTAEQLGLSSLVKGIPGSLPVVLLPGLSGYVGADISAGILATGMAFDGEPSLLLDLGTNGELALQTGRQFHVCATAAGPAFEGSGLTSGARAEDGAVCDVAIRADPFAIELGRLGARGHAVRGICGSAYLDFLAEGARSGLLTASGRFAEHIWSRVPDAFRAEAEGARAIRLDGDARHNRLLVSEADIARLLQAKAAIGAGVETLLVRLGMRPDQIKHLYLAGGFGLHLHVEHAISIGLLPGFRADQVRVVGNSALAGALLAALDREALAEMESLRARTTVVELNRDPGFEDRYIDHLSLPPPP